MNTNNLTQYRIPFGDPAWYRFRSTGLTDEDSQKFSCPKYEGGIGSSEMPHVQRLMDDWPPCPQEIYHTKVGSLELKDRTNMNMVLGQMLEPFIAILWRIYEGPECNYAAKAREYLFGDAKTRAALTTRDSYNLNGYYVNNKYPYLFSSYDNWARKGTVGLLHGKDGKPMIHKYGFPVECKRVSRKYARTWVNGIPDPHVVQLNQEMICSNSDYGEIAVLYDDNKFEIFPFYRNKEICDSVIESGKMFWNKVMPAREWWALRNKYYMEGKSNEAEHMQALIDSNEPEPLESEAYNEWIRGRVDTIIPTTEGDYDLYEELQIDESCLLYSGMIDGIRTGIQNKIFKLISQTGAEKIDFGAYGYVTYKPDKNGKKSLRKYLTFKPSKELAEEEFKKLNFKLM